MREGAARTRLKNLGGSRIELDYLTGTPELRAALWETLNPPSSLPPLQNLFTHFAANVLELTVSFKLDRATPHDEEFSTDLKIFDKQVLVTITRFAQSPSYGVDIRDAKDCEFKFYQIDSEGAGKRACQMDEQHLARLKRSEAYQHPLYRRLVGQGTESN